MLPNVVVGWTQGGLWPNSLLALGFNMRLKSKIASVISILKLKMLGKKTPIAVRFQLTNRCDHRCHYCNVWKTKSNELSTDEVLSLLRELKDMGTKRISFSGGEPLLRNDIGKIINYCKDLRISPSMNSRGAGIEKKIVDIKKLDLLKVSIDGPEQIHDYLSGRKGAFKQSLRAVEISQKNGIKVTLTTTMTKYNIEHLDFVRELAKKYNTVVAFQPLKRLSRGVREMEDIYPERKKYRNAIEKLIEIKKQGNGHMRNSLIGLKHIYHWPDYPHLECSAGKLFCIIETNGDLYPCDRINYKTELPNCVELGFRKAFENLPQVNCSGCGFCGSLELNFLMGLRFGTISTVWRLIKKERRNNNHGNDFVSNFSVNKVG